MTRGDRPQGAYPNAKSVAFWGLFSRIPISGTSVCSPFSPHSFPYLSPHFTPLLLFPQNMNKKLSHRRQNALSMRKTQERNNVSGLHSFPYLSPPILPRSSSSPKGAYIWGYFSCIPVSRTSIPSLFSPHSLPCLSPLPFHFTPLYPQGGEQ